MSRKQYTVSQKALLLASKVLIQEIGCDPKVGVDAIMDLIRRKTGQRFWKFSCSREGAREIGLQYANGGSDIDFGFLSRYITACTRVKPDAADELVAQMILDLCDNLGYALREDGEKEEQQEQYTWDF